MATPNSEPEPNADVQRLIAEYDRLCHAMMTGVGFVGQLDPAHMSAKHTRTGVNSALVSHSALARVLIDKGVMTEAEYWQAVVTEMQAEVNRYTEQLRTLTGGKTTIELV